MHVRALKALQEPVEHWDTVLIYILTGKLDGKTRRDWEIHVGDDKNSTFKDLIEFLSNRCQILEMSDKVYDGYMHRHYTVKALLDTGSQSNFITKDLCQKLNLKTNKSSLSISGLNQTLTKTTMKCHNITDCMSLSPKNIVNLKIPECIELADTSFHNAGPIDILLGATIFFEILCKNQILLGKDKPILQETLFGWIVAGSIQVQNQKQVTSLLCNEQELQDQLRLFWEIEEPSVQKIKYSHEEEECLKYFNETTTRRKFIALEKKFQVNPSLHKQYVTFMKEYEDLGQ
ncbi:hypothetical protein QE152_g14141 [Popillia japonica]|uniref:Peptidase aspartic putative domain-containing protein n=1 Tax=Popillia japonica TaxID=7064 RepID=A0AAW1L9S1_POPJA